MPVVAATRDALLLTSGDAAAAGKLERLHFRYTVTNSSGRSAPARRSSVLRATLSRDSSGTTLAPCPGRTRDADACNRRPVPPPACHAGVVPVRGRGARVRDRGSGQ